jgi:glycosyltransferase involved in cell wall biosynthesis
MHIHFDNIIFNLQRSGGASVYWHEMTTRIAENSFCKTTYTVGNKFSRFLPVLSTADIFHSSHFRYSFPRRAKIVVTIHDVTYERGLNKTSSLGQFLNIWERKQAIDKADSIICISESTKKEMLAIYPNASKKPIHVIHHGVSFSPNDNTDISMSPRLSAILPCPHKFVLFVGVRTFYKNFTNALFGFAYSSLPVQGYRLICTGRKFEQEELKLIDKLKLTNQVFVVDYATKKELQYLYRNAFALTYTSTYEGFGLPPLEAMSFGCPVIASNTSSMPEIIGDGGILIDQIEQYENVSQALDTLLDNNLRTELITRGFKRSQLFSWEKCAVQHMEVYQSLLK